MSSSSSPLAQLRSRYPMAILITELATVYEGIYVVRALVQINGTNLATGLASHTDVEQAEDRAKQRAIEALELGSLEGNSSSSRWTASDTFNLLNQPIPKVLSDISPTVAEPVFAAASLDTAPPSISDLVPEPPLVPSPLSQELLSPEVSPEVSSEPFSGEPASIVADFYTHIQDNTAEADEEIPDISTLVVPASTLLHKTPRRRSESTKEVPPTPAPVDFSDVLAQTDVELRRLGWDARRGREYLKQTYSKRSRQELNEDELYDFLNYLKGQPSPNQSPF